MARYDFTIKLAEEISDINYSRNTGEIKAVLRFDFVTPINGLRKLVVICTDYSPTGVSEQANEQRLLAVYPFSSYPAFARFQALALDPSYNVYGGWDVEGTTVTNFALQMERAMRR